MLKLGFGNKCLLGLILGLVAGRILPQYIINFIVPFGNIFLQLLQVVIVPLTFSTIVASFSKLDNIKLVKSLGIHTVLWFIITAIIAATLGILIGIIINPGSDISLIRNFNYQARNIPNISQTFLDMIPGNLIEQIAKGKIIPVILFAIFFGLGVAHLGDKCKNVRSFFIEFSQTMFIVTRAIIRLSPYGIFALLVDVSHRYGVSTVIPLAKFIIAIYLACIIQIIVYGILIAIFAKKNPIIFFKQFWPAMLTGFTTSSSLASLPVVIETLVDRVGINNRVAGFVAPLGATMKMDGCGAIFPAIVCIMTATMFGINLSIQQYVMIVITSAIATIGTAGVPGTASIMATVVLTSVGLPIEGLALVIGIDKIVDMIRTMTNVTGSGACTVIIEKSFKI